MQIAVEQNDYLGAAAGISVLCSRIVFRCSGSLLKATIPLVTRRTAAELLNRIHEAAQQQNYEGTFVYQRGQAGSDVADHAYAARARRRVRVARKP